MKSLAAFLFEHSPWGEFFSAWSVGFCTVIDGQVYLTEAGQEYLDGLEE